MLHLHRRLTLQTLFWASMVAVLAVLAASVEPATQVEVLGASASRPADPPVAQFRSGCAYYVRPGDNLFRIGLRYDTSYLYLASLNGLPDPNLIYAGSVLSVPCGGGQRFIPVPKNCPAAASYTVQPGDNLFRIALNHGSLVDWIRSANHLYGRVLRSGMQLIIPCPGTVPYAQVPPAGQSVQAPTAVPAAPTAVPATPTPPPGAQVIQMQGSQFTPNNIQVPLGTTIIWLNNDTAPHTVTSGQPGSPNGTFDSGTLQPGGRFQFQPTTGGVYSYFSQTDPTMTGSISVGP